VKIIEVLSGSNTHFILRRLHSQQLWVPLRTFCRFGPGGGRCVSQEMPEDVWVSKYRIGHEPNTHIGRGINYTTHFILRRLHSQQLWVPLRTFCRFGPGGGSIGSMLFPPVFLRRVFLFLSFRSSLSCLQGLLVWQLCFFAPASLGLRIWSLGDDKGCR
jgi:hypothetical protein